jgi:hypothetical protein
VSIAGLPSSPASNSTFPTTVLKQLADRTGMSEDSTLDNPVSTYSVDIGPFSQAQARVRSDVKAARPSASVSGAAATFFQAISQVSSTQADSLTTPGRFHPLDPPATENVARVLVGTAPRTRRRLEAPGIEEGAYRLAKDEPLVAMLTAASIRSAIATGPEAGAPCGGSGIGSIPMRMGKTRGASSRGLESRRAASVTAG